jgi:hypothetical protein
LSFIVVTAMEASPATLVDTVFMDGRDNGPAMTRLGMLARTEPSPSAQIPSI